MRRYLILGIAVYAFHLVSHFPAQLALHWFAPAEVQAYGVEGPIWKGSAQALRINQMVVEETSWDLSTPWMLIGTLKADVKSRLGESSVKAIVSRSFFGNTTKLKSLHGIVTLANIPQQMLSQARSMGLTEIAGRVGVSFQDLHLVDGWPSAGSGTIDIVDLVLSTQFGIAELGSFEVIFADKAADSDPIVGQISDTDSALTVSGTLSLNPDRSYRIDAVASPNAGAAADLVNALSILGRPEPGGGTRLEFAGMMP